MPFWQKFHHWLHWELWFAAYSLDNDDFCNMNAANFQMDNQLYSRCEVASTCWISTNEWYFNNCKKLIYFESLNLCALVTPYGIMEPGQHWFMLWLLTLTLPIHDLHPRGCIGNKTKKNIFKWHSVRNLFKKCIYSGFNKLIVMIQMFSFL